MQNQEQSNMPIKEELRLKSITRIVAFVLGTILVIIPVFVTLDRFPGKGLLVPMVITGAILILGSAATFFVFPAWYRYRHIKNSAETTEETELFP